MYYNLKLYKSITWTWLYTLHEISGNRLLVFIIIISVCNIHIHEYVKRTYNVHNAHRYGGACGVMVIIAGCGHDDMSSNPGRTWLHLT